MFSAANKLLKFTLCFDITGTDRVAQFISTEPFGNQALHVWARYGFAKLDLCRTTLFNTAKAPLLILFCIFLTLAINLSLSLSLCAPLPSAPQHMQTGLTTIVKSAHMIKWYTGTRRNSCGRWLGQRPGTEAGGQTLAFNHRGR